MRLAILRAATASLALGGALLAARAASADDLPPSTVHTKPAFDPKVDGLSFENSGDFESPDGNCFGMSLFAIERFFKRRDTGAPLNAPSAPKPHKLATPGANVDQEELVSYLQQNISQNPMHEAKLANPKNVLAALVRIAKTGDPEIFTMTGPQGGHANVIFGYENGCVLLLDPNYPHQTIAWPFDWKNGFGAHPLSKSADKHKDFYAVLKTAGATPFAKFKAAREIEVLSDPDKLHKASIPRYPQTTVSVASEPAPHDRIAITGTVTGGPKKDEDGNKALKPTRVWLTVDDQPVAHANVQPGGSFKLTIPHGLIPANAKEVHVVVTIDSKDKNAQDKTENFKMFAGYIDVDPKQLQGSGTPGIIKPLKPSNHPE